MYGETEIKRRRNKPIVNHMMHTSSSQKKGFQIVRPSVSVAFSDAVGSISRTSPEGTVSQQKDTIELKTCAEGGQLAAIIAELTL